MKRLFNSLRVVILTIIVFSCSKYPEGPKFSLISKKSRIIGDWVLISSSSNGQSVSLTYYSETMSIKSDGTMSKSVEVNYNGINYSDNVSGKWEFVDKKRSFTQSFPSVQYNQNFEILRLTNDELKIKTIENGDTKIYIYNSYGGDGCNCGEIINDEIEFGQNGAIYYTLTIKNNCSNNSKKFYFDYDTWLASPVGTEFCVENVATWIPIERTISKHVNNKKL